MIEGFLLSRHENTMRVALQNSQDVVEFVDVQGNWLSEDLEEVHITFEWQRSVQSEEPLSDGAFVCSQELADHLIRLLESDSDEEETASPKYLTAGHTIM